MANTGGEPAAGVAYVDIPQSRAAGEAAAREALERAGGVADFAFCFHHGRHDAEELLQGLRAALGQETPIVGGTAMGVITNDELGYEGHQVGVAVAALPNGPPSVVTATGLTTRDPGAVGEELGLAIAGERSSDPDVLLLYSSIRRGLDSAEGMALNFGTPLVNGLLQSAAGEHGAVAGAGLIDSLQPTHSHVLAERSIDPHGAVAVLFGDSLHMDTVVLHGCRPAGAYHTITRSDGPVVLEIDGRPALEVIDTLLGGEIGREQYPFNVILGVNRGDRFGPFDEQAYQTRLCLALDEERQGLVMFEPDLEPGVEVQLMRMSTDLSYVPERINGLLSRLGDRKPLLALYADCAGRCVMASPLEEEEGHAVREAVGEIPLLGFYTGVEIANVAGRVRPLDWTGVLCVLSA